MKNDQVTPILNTLVTINKNRITGYKEILHMERDLETDKKSTLKNRISRSEKNIVELEQLIRQYGGIIEDKTSTAGIIYNTWMDIAYENTGKESSTTLKSGEDIETIVLKAYTSALLQLDRQTGYDIIRRQKEEIAAAEN